MQTIATVSHLAPQSSSIELQSRGDETYDKLAEIDDRVLQNRGEFGIVAISPETTNDVSSLKAHGVEAFLTKALQGHQTSRA